MNYMETKLLRECLKRDEGGSLVAHLVEHVPCIKAELLLPWLEFDSSFAACHHLSLFPAFPVSRKKEMMKLSCIQYFKLISVGSFPVLSH